MPFRRKVRSRMGKAREKHSGTKIHVIGPGTVIIPNHLMRDTEQGARDPAGAIDTITLGRSNDSECNQGDAVRFINIQIQAGPKTETFNSFGWIEWAFVLTKNSDPTPTNANIGTQTLGDICTKYFRNNCLYTGNIPIGLRHTNSASISLKIPKDRQQLKTGDEWQLYLYARNVSATETGTNTFKVVSSFNYINHH